MKQLFIALLISFAVFANIRVPDISSGENLLIYTRFVNDAGNKVSDASLRFYIYPSDEFVLAKNFDINRKSDTQFAALYDSSLKPGEYLLKATANHKDFKKKTRFALFTVY